MNNKVRSSVIILLYHRYPYFALSLTLFILMVFFWILRPNQRRPMFLSGLLSMPYGIASVVFIPEYWNPVLLIKGIIGLEDLLFSLSNGLLAWAVATLGQAKSWMLSIRSYHVLSRYFICTCSGVGVSLLVWFSGLSVMNAALVSIVGLGAFILWLRKEFWKIALTGALGFGLLYSLTLKGVFMLNPDFLSQWNLSGLSGIGLGGIPLEEVGWALGFGGVWPIFMAYVFDGRPTTVNG